MPKPVLLNNVDHKNLRVITRRGARFGDAVMAALYSMHLRAPRTLKAEEYEQIDLDRSIDIFRQRFSSARDMTFIIVGSFDEKAIRPLLARVFPLEQIAAAQREFLEKTHVGKFALIPPDPAP